MKLSEKLIKLRKEKGLSQEQFGNEINVSRQAVSKWETEEAIPDIDKIKEIVKKFNISYEYLLNDEIEEEKILTNNPKKRKIIWKIILIIFLLYLLICVYKFIAFYRFYLVANSFSEENYSMSQILKLPNQSQFQNLICNITKVGKRIIKTNNLVDLKDENGNALPNNIEFTDIDKKISYQLIYDEEKNAYHYQDRKEDLVSEEEINELFKDENIVKQTTLDIIPSGFTEILLAAIDPRYYAVSIRNRHFKMFSVTEDVEIKVQLNNDYLVERISQKFEYNETATWSFSYDYVQDHFEEINDPRQTDRYLIVYEEE